MARRKVPSQAASGAETFSDSLVGGQITDGSSQLTNTNFALDRLIPEKDSKTFRTTPFSEFLTLDDLKSEEKDSQTTQTKSEKKRSISFRGAKDDAGKSLFGSLKSRIAASISNIIEKYPAGIMVDKDSSSSISGKTAYNVSYDVSTKTTEFDIETGMFYNTFDLSYEAPNSNTTPETTNPLRNFYSSFKKYVVEISGVTYDILDYEQPDVNNIITLTVSGKPFTGTTYDQSFIIRPNNGLTEEFFSGLDDLEEILLNRETNPKYRASFRVPRDTSGGSKTDLITVEYIWPVAKDGWNLQVVGLAFDSYTSGLSDIAEEIDDYKSNLFVRFMSAPQLFEFDSEDKKAEALFQLYGQAFDKVKKYIDNIAYMRNVSYDGINNLPDLLLKNLANNLGLNTIKLFDEKDLDEILYTRNDVQYSGLTIGKTLVDAEYEFYRRILVNLAYIYKSKGTRSSIKFLLRFIGAPDPMIKIDEYRYDIVSYPKSHNIDNDIRDLITGNKTFNTATFNATTYQYTIQTITGSTTLTRDNYPVEEVTATARKYEDLSNDTFFQMGSGWYDLTLDHRSPDILDEDISITTGRTKTLLTKPKGYTFGEDYFDSYRTLPGLDTGYELVPVIDNNQGEVVNSNSELTFNRKNINAYLSSAQAIDYDVYTKSRNLNLSFGSATLEPQTGVTFAEFADKLLHEQILNSNIIRYKKNYIKLEDIYQAYINSTSFVPYNFPDVNEFINRMGPYWTQVLDQIIPSTTLWTGGNLIENNKFKRSKYTYKFGCQPKEFIEELFPSFETAIEEDFETLLGEEENFRGLLSLTGYTYNPVIEIDGIVYIGGSVIVSGNTNTSNSAKLFNTFPQTGCTSLNEGSTLPLICDYKDYLSPDVTKIKELWRTSLTNLINQINNEETMDGPGCIDSYAPYTAATSGATCTQVAKPKLEYTYYTDVDGIEKIKFTTIKYGPDDCSVKDYFTYSFDSVYTSTPGCHLDIEFTTPCDIYSGTTEDGCTYDTQVNCILTSDIVVNFSGITGVQKGDVKNLPNVYVYKNCEPIHNQYTGYTTGGTAFYNVTECTYILNDVKDNDEIDLLFLDASNCETKVKIQGFDTQMVSGDTGNGYKTGFKIVPKVQYRNSYNYGLKSDTKVILVSGATISNSTTPTDIENYLLAGTLVKTNVSGITAGNVILTAEHLHCSGFTHQDFRSANLNNDYSFSFNYKTSVVTDKECLGSVRKSIISGLTVNEQVVVFEYLPTSKLRVYTKKEVNETTSAVILRKSYFFDDRFPEFLQVKPTQIEPCCDHSEDYYEHGDYIITEKGELIEVIAVDLNYCEPNLYFSINITSDSSIQNLVLFNGNGNFEPLTQHKYDNHMPVVVDMGEQQYYTNNTCCTYDEDIHGIDVLTRDLSTPCVTPYPILVPCGTVYPTPMPTVTAGPTPTPSSTPMPTPTPSSSATPPPTGTATPTPTLTGTATSTPTPTPSTTSSATPTPTGTNTPTPTLTGTNEPTSTPTPTPSATPNCEFEVTAFVATPTPTPTVTENCNFEVTAFVATPTPTGTNEPTPTPTENCEFEVTAFVATPTPTPTNTNTPTPTENCEFEVTAFVATPTPTGTNEPTATPTSSATPTPTPTENCDFVVTVDIATPTPTPSSTPSSTPDPSSTPTPTPTENCEFEVTVDIATPTPTPSSTPDPSATPTPSPSGTNEPTNTPTPTPTENCDFEIVVDIATPTPTGTNEPTATPTPTPTLTGTNEPTSTPTPTATANCDFDIDLDIATPTPTGTSEPTPTPTLTGTNEPTPTGTNEPTATPTLTGTNEPTNTPTPTPTENCEFEVTVDIATPTPTPTLTGTNEPTPTPTLTGTNEPTNTPTPTATVNCDFDVDINVATPTPTGTSEPTPTPTLTETNEPTPTGTSEPTPTPTLTGTNEPTNTPTPTETENCEFEIVVDIATPTPTGTNVLTPTPTPTPTLTGTSEPTPTPTPSDDLCDIIIDILPDSTSTPTPTLTGTNEPTPTGTNEPTPTPTETANCDFDVDLNVATPTPTGTNEPTPTPTPTGTNEPTPTGTNEPTPTATENCDFEVTAFVATPTPTPTLTGTNEPTQTPTPTGTNEPTPTATANCDFDVDLNIATPTPTPTLTGTNEPTPTGTNEPTSTPTPTPSNDLCDVIVDILPDPTPTPNPTATPEVFGIITEDGIYIISDENGNTLIPE